MDELGQDSWTSLGLRVSFREMAEKGFGFPKNWQIGLTKCLEMVSIHEEPSLLFGNPEHSQAPIETKSLACQNVILDKGRFQEDPQGARLPGLSISSSAVNQS